ncbi:hypothetical protein BDV12DRAFT_165913 [Aspergillus spectabilis]
MAPRIAIIGGGPAGLTLGRLLYKRNIPFKIFERRQKPTEEELAKASGMLDLHEESGLAALRDCGLYDNFLHLTGECSEAQKVSDKDGNILYKDEGELSERPEISRHALTKLLASHLPADSIKWGQKLNSTSISNTSGRTQIELDFGPHGKQTSDLVIGADGAWSRVRSLLTEVKPHYSGTQSITSTITDITSKYPHLADLVGQGSFSALGLRHGVMSQRGPQDSARIYTFLSLPDEHFPSSAESVDRSSTITKQQLLTDNTLLGRFGAPIKNLVSVACDEESSTTNSDLSQISIKPLYTLPVGTSWPHHPNATLIGDAAHLMCPWAGEGVNLAMWDSLLLSQAIATAYEATKHDPASFTKKLDPLLKDFEVDLVTRAKEKAEETESNGQMMFGEDGAEAFKQFFSRAYGGA